ncbi:SDR family oxidoreductase [Streptomyces sp. NPDC090442]|uniref:SDR family oxidoreductase n=1 Tax=Streptomyces sp. NPDC090442 TaxID=3365962 RepID=UPI0037F46987
MTEATTVLLTGASGAVGQGLLPALRRRHHVIALTHSSPVADVENIAGELADDRFGLDAGAYRALARRVDTVLHCAAVTRFDAAPQSLHNVNVLGTRRVAQFAADAGSRLFFMSSAFTARAHLASGRGNGAPANHYVLSKVAAEEALAESGVPAVVLRPSILLGDSRTGRMSQTQGVHVVIRSMMERRIALLPLHGETPFDFIAQDVLAQATLALMDSGRATGEFWLTAGEEYVSVGQLAELCLKYSTGSARNRVGPRLIPHQMMERLIRPAFADSLSGRELRRLDRLQLLTSIFDVDTPLPTSFGTTPELPALGAGDLLAALEATIAHLAAPRQQVVAP